MPTETRVLDVNPVIPVKDMQDRGTSASMIQTVRPWFSMRISEPRGVHGNFIKFSTALGDN
jgi:hypothetical protein